ncbi:hypothetical protein TB1_039468 [Malus domestica]
MRPKKTKKTKSRKKTSLPALSTQNLHLNRWGHAPKPCQSSRVKLKDGLMSLRRNCTRSICLLHKCTNQKGGKAAFANLQNDVKVLKMRKFRHKDRPCAISFSSENYSATWSRLLAMKIVRNDSPRSFDKFTKALCPHEPKRRQQTLIACTS